MNINQTLKIIFVLLLIAVIVILSGCVDTNLSTNEIQITNCIYEFFQALSDQNWIQAKSYCVNDSAAFEDVNDIETQWLSNFEGIDGIDINYIVKSIESVSISGKYSEAYVHVNGIILYNSEIIENNPEEILHIYLQKVSITWKLYEILEAVTSTSD